MKYNHTVNALNVLNPDAIVSPTDFENFYEHERRENRASTKSLLQLHETVISALGYAVELGWLSDNPAESVNPCAKDSQILFTAFLESWLKMMQTTVKLTTYSGYAQSIKNRIIPYFNEHHPGLRLTEITAQHIQDYYTHEMLENGMSANTVKHRHANIRKALQYAYTIDLIPGNPAAKVELPKIEKYVGTYFHPTAAKYRGVLPDRRPPCRFATFPPLSGESTPSGERGMRHLRVPPGGLQLVPKI